MPSGLAGAAQGARARGQGTVHRGVDPELTVRPLRLSDAARLRELSGDQLDHLMRGQLDGCQSALVVNRRGTPAGLAVIDWSGPQAPEARLRFPRCPEIHSVEVDATMRGAGVGSWLQAICEGMVVQRGYDCAGVGVAIDNVHAYALYLRLGYSEPHRVEYPAPPPTIGAAVSGAPMRFLVKTFKETP